MKNLNPRYKIKLFIELVFILVILLLAVKTAADNSMNNETMDSERLATILRNGLFTKFLDSASVTAWKTLITTLNQKGETLHSKRVAWICLVHPLYAGRKVGAMSIINMYDLSNPQEVSALLAIDNDCLRTTFVDLAENGYLVKYDVAPQIAELLEDERYLRRNRQGRLVYIMRALYHYNDTSVVSKVAYYLDDESKKVREISARTLGKITGHTFSRTGDMDFTPQWYYIAKAKIWWCMNKGRSEFKPVEKHLKTKYRYSEKKNKPKRTTYVQRLLDCKARIFLCGVKLLTNSLNSVWSTNQLLSKRFSEMHL